MSRRTRKPKRIAIGSAEDAELVGSRLSVSKTTAAESTSSYAPLRKESPFLPPAVELWLARNAAGLAISCFLMAATVAVYVQAVGFEFVSFDDGQYVTANHYVKQGFTLSSLKWAFAGVHSANWHPLTTLTHILDWSVFGSRAGGHHLVSVLLHAASSVVLFLALRRLTGATWRSGVVAALFCLHPLHVESVAWVSERKDVLSGLFFGLTLWAYAAYAQAPVSWVKYLFVVLLFALGLLSKPMLVTMPFLLLLLDFWPLGRFDWVGASEDERATKRNWSRGRKFLALVWEKLPLLALSVASCLVTYLVQRSAGAVTESVSALMRVQTVALAYVRYLTDLFWPFGLAIPYPRDVEFYTAATWLSCVLLAVVTAAVLVFCRKQQRYLLVGWFWFVGMLVPVSGLVVVVGYQSAADRYSYLSYTGLFIALVWGITDLLGLNEEGAALTAKKNIAIPLALFAGLVLLFFGVRTFQQAQVWRNSEVLYRHAIAVTKNNFMAHSNLGMTLEKNGDSEEAEAEFRKAIEVEPRDYQAHNSLGVMERHRGHLSAAIEHYRDALTVKPDFALAHSNLAVAYSDQGRLREAEQECLLAIQLDPDLADAENNLGNALAGQMRQADSIPHYRRAIELDPDRAQHHVNLGIALFAVRSFDEGTAELERAIELSPDDVGARHELAKMYLTVGKAQEAFDQWREVLTRQPSNAAAAKGFGIVLVKGGHGADAIPYLGLALAAAPKDLEARQYMIFARLAARQTDEAMAEFREILRRDPNDRRVQTALAQVQAARPNDAYLRGFVAYTLFAMKKFPEAVAEFRAVLRIDPKNVDALNSLAWIEAVHPDARMRNGKEALTFAEEAAALRPKDAQALDTLAATYAEAGRFKEAVDTARKAAQLAEKLKSPELSAGIAARLKLYESGKPYRDNSLRN
jgi:tetratricopeptide (TPR) repeat protein